MSKQGSASPVSVNKTPHPPEHPVIGQSGCYKIKKFGSLRYQLFRIDEGKETPVLVENTYGIIAVDLVDLMYREIVGGS